MIKKTKFGAASLAITLAMMASQLAPAHAETTARGARELGTLSAGRDLRPVTPDDQGQARRPKVSLIPNAEVVRIGDTISFSVRSSIDGYGHLYVLSASGRVQLWVENSPIEAGRTVMFPSGAMGVRASAPAGRDQIVLVVTKNRMKGFAGRETTLSPQRLDLDHAEFKQALDAKLGSLPKRSWAAEGATVRVVEGRSTRPAAFEAEGNNWNWRPLRAATSESNDDAFDFDDN
jgi:Domain of unknown function (DUF4384)